MPIYKDEVAREEGNAVAKMKCVELAISKMPHPRDFGKEAEQVLAGILGCK